MILHDAYVTVIRSINPSLISMPNLWKLISREVDNDQLPWTLQCEYPIKADWLKFKFILVRLCPLPLPLISDIQIRRLMEFGPIFRSESVKGSHLPRETCLLAVSQRRQLAWRTDRTTTGPRRGFICVSLASHSADVGSRRNEKRARSLARERALH